MLVTTLNVNGLRSAARRGFRAWLEQRQPDVLCLQEVRALPGDIEKDLLEGWTMHWNPAQQKGYAGTAILCKKAEGTVTRGLGLSRADEEGRLIGLHLPEIDIWSVYVPSGTSGPERQAWKMEFLEFFRPWLAEHQKKTTLVCGDINIAHTPKDIKNAKSNEKNSGFLPEERAWLTALFASGWRDSFRELYPEKVTYSWWSQRGNAYNNDVGWRIDQQWASPGVVLQEVWIDRDAKLSDHAPVNLRIGGS